MTVFSTILVPVDGSAAATASLECAAWLAARLEAALHVFHATDEPLSSREALARLRIPEAHWPLVTLHQMSVYPEEAIPRAVLELGIDLVVMPARSGQAGGAPAIGHVARAVLEECDRPVLLTPGAGVTLPWRSALVPVSGEAQADNVLTLAVRLAEPLGWTVRVVHVVDGRGYLNEVAFADSPHHEYAGRLRELVGRISRQCSPAQCQCIVQDVALCQGEVAGEIQKLIRQANVDVLVVGWHGDLAERRAAVVKTILRSAGIPVLLVKAKPPPPFVLKVGDAIE